MSAKPANVVLVMFDQLAPQFLPFYGHPLVRVPALERLAERGTVFENAYCNSPLCAPSRYSMLAGRFASRIGAWDNAAELAAGIPTVAHYLRDLGYRTCLAGKMHFAGPDQLHGYEERLTTDIYPSDFGWTPDWERPDERPFWYHDMQSVVEAGVYERTLALDFDDEVAYQSVRKIYEAARDARHRDPRPLFLTVSFTQPHDPYMTPRRYWDRYDHDAIDPPAVAAIPFEDRDPHAQRLYRGCATDRYRIDDAHVRSARHAYYGMIAWLDERVGALADALEAAGIAGDTLWVVVADHGDMLGERGMWYKMCFYEHSARVPMLLAGPGIGEGARVARPVSLVDLLPTLLDYATDGAPPEPVDAIDGESLLGSGGASACVVSEYLAEGAVAPMLMLRSERYKYVTAGGDPPQLFDLDADPRELDNLAGDPRHEEARAALARRAGDHWDAAAVAEQVRASQRRRRLVHRALSRGAVAPWDFEPRWDASRQYNRNTGGELYDTDRRARIPYRDPPAPDGEGA